MIGLRLLLEGSRDNMLLAYLPKVQEVHPECTLSQLKTFLLNKFVNEGHIRSLSMPSNFYLVGVARYYFNGDLTTNKTLNIFDEGVKDEFIEEVCKKLSAVIRVLRDKYLDSEGTSWDQPEDFGKLKLSALFKKYGKAIDKEMGIERNYEPEKKEDKSLKTTNITLADYTFEIMYNQSDCQKYENPTSPGSWCITYAEQHYNHYTKVNNSFFVIFKRKDWESVKRPETEPEGFPLDYYGTSLMAIQLSKNDGTVVGGTTRWNHGADGIIVQGDADGKVMFPELHALTGITQDQLAEITNVWRHNAHILCVEDGNDEMSLSKEDAKDAIRQFNYIQICINKGQNPFLESRAFPNGMLKNPIILDYETNTYLQRLGKKLEIDPTKVWKKCCLGVEIQINDNPIYAIMDRGKLYHKYTMTELPFRNSEEHKNFIAIKVSTTKMACYDILRHRPISCETYKFSEVILSVNDDIAILKLATRQYKIYNAKSGKFVKNNGYDTFEYVVSAVKQYRNIINNSYVRPFYKENILTCVIDMSAGSFFYYDIFNDKSIVFGDDFVPSNSFSDGRLYQAYERTDARLSKYGQSIVVANNIYFDRPLTRCKIYDVKKGKIFSIDGYKTFKAVSEICYGKLIRFVLPNNKFKFVFEDDDLNELVSSDGSDIVYADYYDNPNNYESTIYYLSKKGNLFVHADEYGSEPQKIETPNISVELISEIAIISSSTSADGTIYIVIYYFNNGNENYVIYKKDFTPLRGEDNKIILFYDFENINVWNSGLNCKIYGQRYYNDKYEYYISDDASQKNVLALIGTYNNIKDSNEDNEQETIRENFYRIVNYII